MATGSPPSAASIEQAYALARERYSAVGVDTERALERLARLSLSLHCWQGDDVGGFELGRGDLGGGLAVTGAYPGKARTPGELRADLDVAYALIPGRHRLNLHASYAEPGGARVDRDAIRLEHFTGWIQWARERGLGIDFNPTCFSHPRASGGFTLAHPDQGIRDFWIEHCKRCREIGAGMGEALGSPCVTNVWIPDGLKDLPADRLGPRRRLVESLDRVLEKKLDPRTLIDSVEAKLFGIGSECYVVGSHEFYLGYAASRGIALCLDAGHFHPTESIADKISSTLLWVPRLLLHVSRGVRWDSDHVVTLTDELLLLAQEVVQSGELDRIHLGLDYFDASINRIAAWVIGARNFLKALLKALLDPIDQLRRAESEGDYTTRLALQEEMKSLPLGAVWDMACHRANVPAGSAWLEEVRRHEREVLLRRGST